MSHPRWKAELADGTEIFVELTLAPRWQRTSFGMERGAQTVESVSVAFRAEPHHSWGPPVTCERAP